VDIGARYDNIAHTIEVERPDGYDGYSLSLSVEYGNAFKGQILLGTGNTAQITSDLMRYQKLNVQVCFAYGDVIEQSVEIIQFIIAPSIHSGDPPEPPPTTGTPSRQMSVSYEQASAAATWTIQHNLNRDPKTLYVIVTDTNGDVHYPDIDYAESDANALTLKFGASVAGTAYITY
jgi:hypothetical protein